MTGYDDDALSTDTVLRAIANNATLTGHGTRRHPRRMQLLDRMHLADAIDISHAIYIGPDSEWACPITFSDVGGQYPSVDMPGIARMIRHDFEALARNGSLQFPNWRNLGGTRGSIDFTYPSSRIVATLAGRDLACTCPLDEACHGDVLLRLANPQHHCPECAQGKHRNCTDITLDHDDTWTLCNCHDTTHPTRTATALAAARQEAANRP